MKRLLVSICICLAAVLKCAAVAYTPSTVPNPKVTQGQMAYVADPDRILSDSDVYFLNTCAARLEKQTQAELCVVALSSIGDADCFDFTYELFQRWGIGKQGKNTGVLIVFVLDSHDIRIMTGVGIEGVLPDALCSRIIHDDMIPSFREGRYGPGLCLGVLRIYEECTHGSAPEELINMLSVTDRGRYANSGEVGGGQVALMLGLPLGIFVLAVLLYRRSRIKKCPKCRKRKGHMIREQVLLAPGYNRAGKGDRTYICKHCGHMFVLPYTIPALSRSITYTSGGGSYGGYGGGSFGGGFGGGSFGGGSTMGGGAGGKW